MLLGSASQETGSSNAGQTQTAPDWALVTPVPMDLDTANTFVENFCQDIPPNPLTPTLLTSAEQNAFTSIFGSQMASVSAGLAAQELPDLTQGLPKDIISALASITSAPFSAPVEDSRNGSPSAYSDGPSLGGNPMIQHALTPISPFESLFSQMQHLSPINAIDAEMRDAHAMDTTISELLPLPSINPPPAPDAVQTDSIHVDTLQQGAGVSNSLEAAAPSSPTVCAETIEPAPVLNLQTLGVPLEHSDMGSTIEDILGPNFNPSLSISLLPPDMTSVLQDLLEGNAQSSPQNSPLLSTSSIPTEKCRSMCQMKMTISSSRIKN
ncbi:hypothetical protein FRC02_005498 [Tulasnella sp. 418]|nr:hypothetical protein FRC02_005498 [Tulasnella sp. 418]